MQKVSCLLRWSWLVLAGILITACTSAEFARDYNKGVEYFNKGVSAIKSDQYNNAIVYFDNALFEFKFAEREQRWMLLGKKSEEGRREAASLIGRCHLYSGLAYYQTKKYAEAIEEIEAAFETPELENADRVTAYATRGLAYFATGQTWKAESDYWSGVAFHLDSALMDVLKNKLFP